MLTHSLPVGTRVSYSHRVNGVVVHNDNTSRAFIYRKVGESQLSDEQIASTIHLVRGAQYRLESL